MQHWIVGGRKPTFSSKDAHEIIRKCEHIQFNAWKRYRHALKLDNLNITLQKFTQIYVPLLLNGDVREILVDVKGNSIGSFRVPLLDDQVRDLAPSYVDFANKMSNFMEGFDHLLKSYSSDNNCLGRGGFGKVYKGEFLHPEGGRTLVAVKRLDRARGQGDVEFWKEVLLLPSHTHENLISLQGFCDENNEKVLVYEYAHNRSLDFHLSDANLTWIQRLKICLGAARGLEYLHNPHGTQQRILHRDIKSANILLDENWNAKIAYFGLSKVGPANQQYTFLVTDAVGTLGYCDPKYMETMVLTKESDVYSFGVVLLEVLCARICVDFSYSDDRRVLVSSAKTCYEQQKLHTIIGDSIRQQITPASLDTFGKIAYQCVQSDREKRPSMDLIVTELQSALDYQEGTNLIPRNVNLVSSTEETSTHNDNEPEH